MITAKGIDPEYIKNQLEGVKPNREEDKEYEKASHWLGQNIWKIHLVKVLDPEYNRNPYN